MSRLVRITMVASVVAAMAMPAVAGAHVLRGWNATFPIASRLCAKTAAGHPPKKLAGQVTAVTAACTTLKTSYTNAQNTWSTTVAPLKDEAVQAVKTLRADCKADRAAGNKQACRNERLATRAKVLSLRSQVVTATLTYHTSVQAARKTFWGTIHTLKGGATIQGDTTVGPGPANPLPSTSSVDSAATT